MRLSMVCHCYLRDGTVYVPTFGKIEEGFYRDVEPVAVIPISDTDALRRAFHETIARGNPAVPNLLSAAFPDLPVLRYAGVKSWRTFERGMSIWAIEERSGGYRIVGKRRQPNGAWIENPEEIVTFPPGTGVDEVCERIVAILQETACR